jgi:hypothetical protein
MVTRFGWVFAVVAVGASGCASLGNVQRADTVGDGNTEFALEPGAWGAVSGAGPTMIPHLDLAVRHGVTERVDVGARFGWSLLEVQGKFLLTEPSDPAKAISLAPTLGGLVIGGLGAGAGLLNIGFPVLIGFKLGGGNELILGPRLQTWLLFGAAGGSGAVATLLAPGATIGFAAPVGDMTTLLPELAVVVPALNAGNFSGVSLPGASGAFIQFKLGILFGQTKHTPGKPVAPRPSPFGPSTPVGPPPAYPPPPPPPVDAPPPPMP